MPTEEELFARMSLEELNAKKPLGDVFFALDSSDLTDEARASLQKNADYLKKWASLRISVEGHCDERGTAEYNLALGERRATAVRTYLDQPRRRRRSDDGRQQGQGAAVLQRARGGLLLAEPPRPLPDHREVARLAPLDSRQSDRNGRPLERRAGRFTFCSVSASRTTIGSNIGRRAPDAAPGVSRLRRRGRGRRRADPAAPRIGRPTTR